MASSIITTVAGTGTCGFSGDGGPAVNATLNTPEQITTDVAGNLFFADNLNNRVRRVSGIAQSGFISPSSGAIPWHPHHTVRLSAALGVSVDLADGHVDVSADDMSLPARALDLTLRHTWDSTLAQAGTPLSTTAGTGWLDSLTPTMGGTITGTLSYIDASGAVWSFPYAGPLTATAPYTQYQTPPGLPLSLTVATVPSTVYTLTNVLTGAVRVFDGQGRLFADADSYGNYNLVSYTGTAPMTVTETNSGGRALSTYYNASGPSAGLLSATQSPLNKATSGAQGQLVVYGYNGARQLSVIAWGHGSPDEIGATFGYSGTQLVTMTTPGGHQWLLGYDAARRLSSLSSPAAGVTPAYTTTFAYSPAQTQLVEGAGSGQPVTTTFGLDAQGEPISITDALSHSSTAAYGSDHTITSSTDANNHTTSYAYHYVGPPGAGSMDGLGSVGLVTQTVQPAIAAYTYTNSLSSVLTRYYYNQSNDLTATVGPEGSATTLYGYDGRHSVITTTQLLTDTPSLSCPQAIQHHPSAPSSAASLPASLPAPLSASSLPTRALRPHGVCTYTFAWRASVTSYTAHGQLSGQTDGRGVSAPQTTSQDSVPLDSAPAVTLAANSAQDTRHWSYYGVGDLYAAGTPPLSTISGTVSSTGPATTTYGYTGDGLRDAVVAPNGGVSYASYNHLGWLNATAQSSVPLWSGGSGTPYVLYSYDGDGNLLRTQDALGGVTTSAYDPQGRTLAITDPLTHTTRFTYTATTLASSSDPAGNVTQYGYDAAARLSSQSDPAAPAFLTQYGYDAVGNTTAITTPLDYNRPTAATVETRTYDALNALSTETVAGSNEITPTAAQTTYTSYDHAGRVVEGQAPNGDVTYSLYDQGGRHVESDLYPSAVTGPASPPPPASQFDSRDAADNLNEQFDFTLYDHQFSYDGANRLSGRLDCLSSCVVNTPLSTQYGYDPNGNTVALTRTEPGGAVITATATYNANDWLSGQSDGQGVGETPFTTTFGYDALGRLRTQSLLGGTNAGLTLATLDAAGRATAIGEVITDTGQAPSGSSSAFGYTADNLPYTATLNSGSAGQVQETRQYDPDNRLTCLTAAGPSGVVTPLTDGFTYSYSAQGVLTGITAQTTAAACQGSGYAPATVVAHDAFGRVTATNGALWGYDGNGNLRSQVITTTGPVTTVYNYAAADGSAPAGWLPNEVISTTFGVPTGQLVQAFGYDASGATTAITTGAYGTQPQVTATLRYNAQGRLAGVTTSDGRGVSLGYTAQGLRASISVTDTRPTYGGTAQFSERLLYRGGRVGQVAVLEGTHSFTETFLYRADGTPLELLYQQQRQPTQRYWYVVDGQGSVVALTNSLGAVIDQYSYDLWGGLTSLDINKGINEGVPQPLRYRGYWYDGWYDGAGDWSATSGTYVSDDTRPLAWYWLTTRAYDPTLKRFLAPDPAARDGVRSYAYAQDDPVDLVDPSGLAGGPIEVPLPGGAGEPVQLRLPGLDGELGGAASDGTAATLPTEAVDTSIDASVGSTAGPSGIVAAVDSFDQNAAIASAKAARRMIGEAPSGKAVAATLYGSRTLSGWEPQPGYEPPPVNWVMEQAADMGFTFKNAGALDQGVPGRYFATHAEVQMTEIVPDEPMAVSRPMCNNCQAYFKVLAEYSGVPQTVADPYYVRMFYPDGRILSESVRGTVILHPDGRIEGL